MAGFRAVTAPATEDKAGNAVDNNISGTVDHYKLKRAVGKHIDGQQTGNIKSGSYDQAGNHTTTGRLNGQADEQPGQHVNGNGAAQQAD